MGALDGLLVVGLEHAVAAPLCTLRLADAGARVIKIEPPEGDTARHYDASVNGTSAYFAWLNRGKESVVLNLKAQPDKTILMQMLRRADVFVQNRAPGTAERLGFGAVKLRGENPLLITVDIVGYSGGSPYRNKRAYDMLVQAESGLCAVTGSEEAPAKVGVSVVDIATGMNAHAAILEALIERTRTCQGRHIEIAMFDCIADWMTVPILHMKHEARVTGRHGLAHASIFPYAAFSCSDGTVVIAIQSDAEWLRFCSNVMQMPALGSDSRFSTNTLRLKYRSNLHDLISTVLSSISCAEVKKRLTLGQIAYANVSSIPELLGHPALNLMEAELPSNSTFYVPRPAGRNECAAYTVPALGNCTDKIFREFGE